MHRLAPIVVVAIAIALALYATSSAQPSPVKPFAPIVVANGASVVISWRLPVSPRPLNVVVLRGESGGALLRVATVEAERRSFTDTAVSLGLSYDYAIILDLRGLPPSAMSPIATVSLGATDRVIFRGGSVKRAVFDIAVFAEGRKFVETFVAQEGEAIGDLRRVDGVEKPLDFRLGCKLLALRLEISAGASIERQAALDPLGNPLLDLGGRPIELSLPARSEKRERLAAEIELAGGKKVTLLEGEGMSP